MELCLTSNDIREERKKKKEEKNDKRRLLLPTTKYKDTLSNSFQDQEQIVRTTNLGLSGNGRSEVALLCQPELIADELGNTKISNKQQQCMRIRSDPKVDEQDETSHMRRKWKTYL